MSTPTRSQKRSERNFAKAFISEATNLSKHLRCGATAIAILGRVGFIGSHVGQKKILTNLFLDADLPQEAGLVEGQRVSVTILLTKLFGDHSGNVPEAIVSLKGRFCVGTADGGSRFRIKFREPEEMDVYLQRMEFGQVIAWGVAVSQENASDFYQFFCAIHSMKTLPDFRFRRLSSTDDVGTLLSEFRAFANGKTVGDMLASSVHVHAETSGQASPSGSMVDTGASSDSSAREQVHAPDDSPVRLIRLSGINQPPTRPEIPFTFPDWRSVVADMRKTESHRDIVTTCTANLERILPLFLGIETKQWKLSKLINTFGKTELCNTPLKKQMRMLNAWWRNPLDHSTKDVVPDLESLGGNKDSYIHIAETVFGQLETLCNLSAVKERLEFENERLQSENERLQSDSEGHQSDNENLRGGFGSGKNIGVGSPPPRNRMAAYHGGQHPPPSAHGHRHQPYPPLSPHTHYDQYRRPPPNNYCATPPPTPHNHYTPQHNHYAPPPQHNHFGPPPPHDQYGPPAPHDQYGTPARRGHFQTSSTRRSFGHRQSRSPSFSPHGSYPDAPPSGGQQGGNRRGKRQHSANSGDQRDDNKRKKK